MLCFEPLNAPCVYGVMFICFTALYLFNSFRVWSDCALLCKLFDSAGDVGALTPDSAFFNALFCASAVSVAGVVSVDDVQFINYLLQYR